MAWLPEDFVHPVRVEVPGGGHLRPIRGADTELDYPAVMGSRERLWTIFGPPWGWPAASMTIEADRADLERHAREIAALVPRWIADAWPFARPRFVGRDLTWAQWMALPEV